VSTVQRPIAGKYFVIQGFDQGALSYYPSLPPQINTLKTVDAMHGYWIKTTVTTTVPPGDPDAPPVATLRLSGVRLAEDTPLPLDAGWNLVSYLPQSTLPVTVALASIAGKYAVVQGFDRGAQSFYPDLDPLFNTLLAMQPGLGYWIRTTQAVTLTYPGPAGQASVSAAGRWLMPIPQPLDLPQALLSRQGEREAPIRQAERAAGVTPTSAWVDFYGEALEADGAPLPSLNQCSSIAACVPSSENPRNSTSAVSAAKVGEPLSARSWFSVPTRTSSRDVFIAARCWIDESNPIYSGAHTASPRVFRPDPGPL